MVQLVRLLEATTFAFVPHSIQEPTVKSVSLSSLYEKLCLNIYTTQKQISFAFSFFLTTNNN